MSAATAAMRRSEANGRAVAMMTALPIVALFLSLGLEGEDDSTLLGVLLEHPPVFMAMTPLFLAAGFIGVRSVRPDRPQRRAQAALTVLVALVLLGATGLLFIFAVERGRRVDDELAFWAMCPWPVIAGWVLGRATRMKGWSAWANKLAAFILGLLPLVLLAVALDRWERMPTAVYFQLLAEVAAVPLAFFALFRVGRAPKTTEARSADKNQAKATSVEGKETDDARETPPDDEAR